MTNDDVARAFSQHRFAEICDHLAEHVMWNLVGETRLEGRDAVVACRATAEENSQTTTTWLRFVSTGDGATVAVDAIGRYDGPDGVTMVSSCDIYESATRTSTPSPPTPLSSIPTTRPRWLAQAASTATRA